MIETFVVSFESGALAWSALGAPSLRLSGLQEPSALWLRVPLLQKLSQRFQLLGVIDATIGARQSMSGRGDTLDLQLSQEGRAASEFLCGATC